MTNPDLHIGQREEQRSGFSGFGIDRFTSVQDRALWVWLSSPTSLVTHMRNKGFGVSGQWIYLPGDYQGWHTNGDVLGQRVYFSWASENNKSGMRFLIEGKVIDSPDKQGWNRRIFTPPVWHSVYCDCIRASIGFLIRDSNIQPDSLQPVSSSNLDNIKI